MVTAERPHIHDHSSHHHHQASEVAEHSHCEGNMACSCDHSGHCCCCEDSGCQPGNCNCHGDD